MTPWWDEFFAEPWALIQSSGYDAARTAKECDLIESELGLEAAARVLDIPCGTGRHCVELARRGYRMTGVELKSNHVVAAMQSAREEDVEVDFVMGDMRTFRSETRFDAAYCFFGSFGYFSDEDNLRFLHSVAAAIEPGGRFLLEGHVTETLFPIFRERDWFWAGPPERRVRVLEERTWNQETGRVVSSWTLIHEHGALSSTTSIRIYSYLELRALLQAAGFATVQLRDGTTGATFQVGACRALVVAESLR